MKLILLAGLALLAAMVVYPLRMTFPQEFVPPQITRIETEPLEYLMARIECGDSHDGWLVVDVGLGDDWRTFKCSQKPFVLEGLYITPIPSKLVVEPSDLVTVKDKFNLSIENSNLVSRDNIEMIKGKFRWRCPVVISDVQPEDEIYCVINIVLQVENEHTSVVVEKRVAALVERKNKEANE